MRNLEQLTKQELVKRRMSIEKLAVEAGLTKSTVLSIFKKNDAKVSQLEAIGEVLQVPTIFFFEDIDIGVWREVIQKSKRDGLNSVSQNILTALHHGNANSDKKDADLELCLERVKGLEMLIKAKDETIEILKKNKG